MALRAGRFPFSQPAVSPRRLRPTQNPADRIFSVKVSGLFVDFKGELLMQIKFWLGWITAVCFSGMASAQNYEALVQTGAGMSPDLTFPTEAKELSMFSPHGMAIFKPAGAGPFPAVVLHHSCGGIRTEIRDWARLALDRGYVVFVLDSLGPRGLKTNCFPTDARAHLPRRKGRIPGPQTSENFSIC